MERLTISALQADIGVLPDGVFGPRSKSALIVKLSNLSAPLLDVNDFAAAAKRLHVPVGHIIGVRKVEAPRGPFDALGRPSILYERHKFRDATVPPGVFDAAAPMLSGPPFGPGGYGAISGQYGKLMDACALDPEAAFRACSWGAFQVMGDYADELGYGNAYNLAKQLTISEVAHLDLFLRYIEYFELTQKLQSCKPNDPDSCRPFVRSYNGAQYEKFSYHIKFAKAIAGAV